MEVFKKNESEQEVEIFDTESGLECVGFGERLTIIPVEGDPGRYEIAGSEEDEDGRSLFIDIEDSAEDVIANDDQTDEYQIWSASENVSIGDVTIMLGDDSYVTGSTNIEDVKKALAKVTFVRIDREDV